MPTTIVKLPSGEFRVEEALSDAKRVSIVNKAVLEDTIKVLANQLANVTGQLAQAKALLAAINKLP